MRQIAMGAAAALLLFVSGSACAATLHFKAALSGHDEVPPNAATGTGKLTATLDTDSKALSYNVTYRGLSGPGVAAHFHGPAAAGANGPVVIPVTAPASPIKGTATLTDAQVADLKAGAWYFNVHTQANPGGEIRGQITAGK
ncbi:MAG: CHRD domain-containing protein [Caulobacterales bacterium]